MDAVLLIAGGLYESLAADTFWTAPGVTGALIAQGFEVTIADRLDEPESWQADAEAIEAALPFEATFAVIAGSNGCSTALRLTLDRPRRVRQLILCWPATPLPPARTPTLRQHIESSHGPSSVERLLSGGSVRGVTDAELATIDVPVAVMPADPEDPYHRHETVDRLVEALPHATRLAGFAESPTRRFAPQLGSFVETVTTTLRSAT